MIFSSDLKIINSCCSISSEIKCKIILYTESKIFEEIFMLSIQNLKLAWDHFASEISWYWDFMTLKSHDWLSCDLNHDTYEIILQIFTIFLRNSKQWNMNWTNNISMTDSSVSFTTDSQHSFKWKRMNWEIKIEFKIKHVTR